MKSILVTGGAGFIGSNFVPYFAEKYPDYHIINLDKLTYAGNLENLRECKGMPNYTFIKGDICDEALIDSLFKEYDIQGVIHFAAEPLNIFLKTRCSAAGWPPPSLGVCKNIRAAA